MSWMVKQSGWGAVGVLRVWPGTRVRGWCAGWPGPFQERCRSEDATELVCCFAHPRHRLECSGRRIPDAFENALQC